MSLTNPSSVVTEERLSDFYQGILPYLGGMPDILANKFDKANMFSTDEKIVGRWIDGKPLYQKSYSASVNITSGSTSDFQIVTGFDYIDVVKVEILRSSDSTRFILPNSGCNVNILSNGNLRLNTASGTSYSGILIFTIQYTKSTDSPVEIGIDTDYSTTEKIIGTWIDGKPIYQKTLKIDNPGNDWNNTVKTYTSLGIDNPDLVWKVGSAILDIGSDHRQYTEHSYGTASYFTVLASSGNNGLLFKWTTSGTSNFIIITLQYTKTTD